MLNRLLQQIGLVNHSVPQNDSGDAAYQRAIKLAQEILPNGPVGVKMAKQAINKGMEVSLIYLSFFSRKLIQSISFGWNVKLNKKLNINVNILG